MRVSLNSKMLFVSTALFSIVGSVSEAGPFVSGGVGAGGTIVKCQNREGGRFEVRTTPAPGYIQGVYIAGNESVSLVCHEKQREADGVMFECREQRAGEGLVTALVYRNSQGFVLAQLGRTDLTGSVQNFTSMVCR